MDRLAANDVPVAAAVYFDDMYVDSGLQLDTASRVGNTQAWVTNEYEHDGIGEERVFARLTQLVRELGGGLTDGVTASCPKTGRHPRVHPVHRPGLGPPARTPDVVPRRGRGRRRPPGQARRGAARPDRRG
ncbi:hypothetical protein GCM10020220_025280 [Nonomuraea rubra]|uniref:hypothetical protein n=1 Tax=Nonomuraea rubra TaxID=46180 RepID=UPI0031ECB99F